MGYETGRWGTRPEGRWGDATGRKGARPEGAGTRPEGEGTRPVGRGRDRKVGGRDWKEGGATGRWGDAAGMLGGGSPPWPVCSLSLRTLSSLAGLLPPPLRTLLPPPPYAPYAACEHERGPLGRRRTEVGGYGGGWRRTEDAGGWRRLEEDRDGWGAIEGTCSLTCSSKGQRASPALRLTRGPTGWRGPGLTRVETLEGAAAPTQHL